MASCTICLAFEVENLNFYGGPIRDMWTFLRFNAFGQIFKTKYPDTLLLFVTSARALPMDSIVGSRVQGFLILILNILCEKCSMKKVCP